MIVGAALLGPLLAAGRRPLVPVLIGELAAGAILGRTGFRLLDASMQPLAAFYALGFAMLMLSAGTRVDLRSPDLRAGAPRAALTVGVVCLLSIPAGWAVAVGLGVPNPWLLAVLLAGSSAALVFPILEERGLAGPRVAFLVTWVLIADALTAVLMPLALTGPGQIPLALAGDAAIVAIGAAVVLAFRPRPVQARMLVYFERSRQRGWALQLRLSILLLLVLATIAVSSGGSELIAGFVAGIVISTLREPGRLALQLSGLAQGFFVPAFFVLLGTKLDLRAMVSDPRAIGLAVAMAVGSVVVHVLASLVTGGGRRRLPAGFMASAQLGLPAAAASLGLASGKMAPALAAALVAGGCLTLIPALVGAALTAPGPAPEGAAAKVAA